jgi:hypothetical protein
MDEAVAKLNIAHFRRVLMQQGLASEDRRNLQQLLTKEEHKLEKLKRAIPNGAGRAE